MEDFNLRNYLYKNPLLEKKEDSKKGNEKEQKRMEGAIRDDRDHIKNLKKDIEDNEKKLARLKKDYKKDVNEDARTDAEEEGYKDGMKDEKEDVEEVTSPLHFAAPKDKKKDKEDDVKETALRSLIREKITAILKEVETEEEDVDIDVEDTEDVDVDIDTEVDIDDESAESEIEVDSELAGEDADTAAILGLLTKAQEEAEALGDEKLMDQIGNTITYYTRAHVVKSGGSRTVAENNRFTRRRK